MSALKQKQKLRRRIRDIAIGAAGYDIEAEGEIATAEFLSRFLPALEHTFGSDTKNFLWHAHNLDHFNDIDTTTDFLFSHGVRAEGSSTTNKHQ